MSLDVVAAPPSPPPILNFSPLILMLSVFSIPAEQINKVYGREMYTALVGAPGQATVYVFEYNADTGEWEEVQVRFKHIHASRTFFNNMVQQ